MWLDDDLLFAFWADNRDPRIERNANGDLEILPPTGAETGSRNAELTLDFGIWARRDGRDAVVDSATGFPLPYGALRSEAALGAARAPGCAPGSKIGSPGIAGARRPSIED